MEAYTLFSSSSGNCTYIKSENEEILIDAGVSAKQIQLALAKLGTCLENIKCIFITHEHTDHIKGIDVISRRCKIPIYAPTRCIEYIISSTHSTEDFLEENNSGDERLFNTFSVSTFSTPHDSLSSVGFRIETANTTLGYATDIGRLTEAVKKGIMGCENVVIESNYDVEMLKNGPYPHSLKQRILGSRGHLSNDDCADFLPKLIKSGCKNAVLAHLSEHNNKPEIAFNRCRGSVNMAGYRLDTDFRLAVAGTKTVVKIL